MNISPTAYFDTLFIVSNLQEELGDVLKSEIHLYSYLGCLLSLYDGQPVSEWGYRFAVTDSGYPFSGEVEKSIDLQIRSGLISLSQGSDTSSYNVTKGGRLRKENLEDQSMFSKRTQYLEGACSSTLALPPGLIRTALTSERTVSNAVKLGQSKLLLDEVATDRLYEDFEAIRRVIGSDVDDFMAPAVTWLTYLAKEAEK